MRKIIGFYTGPFQGTDANIAVEFDDNITDNEIRDWLLDWGLEENQTWADQAEEDGIEGDDFDVWFDDYEPSNHDGLVPGGGEWNFFKA